ncbi:hypothetical protein [Kitasatospora sp. SUK 42]|uniref:hypothetical protein n=1 Tax=Kitasatospora sp. SUK 42 TaxID=1588882 RepID=UPI001C315944|nr:hypothetical protein [Kitasatospora sp. SUK 42]MBV2155439.1 hypothetical protein [Kitasatospora sp. SUK 42]
MADGPGAVSGVRGPAAATGAALAGIEVKGAPSTGRAGPAARWTTPPACLLGAGAAVSPLPGERGPSTGSVATAGRAGSASRLGGASGTAAGILSGPGTTVTGRAASDLGRRATTSGSLTGRGRTERAWPAEPFRPGEVTTSPGTASPGSAPPGVGAPPPVSSGATGRSSPPARAAPAARGAGRCATARTGSRRILTDRCTGRGRRACPDSAGRPG